MKNFLYILLFSIFVILSCSCKIKSSTNTAIVYPNKNLEEISFLGRYNKSNNKKQFRWLGSSACFNEIKDKEPIFDKNLKARLYSNTGKILAEDFIRSDDSDSESPNIEVYFPYYENAVAIHLLKIEDDKEIIFYILSPKHESKLRRYVGKFGGIDGLYGLYGWAYSRETECFYTRGIK